MLIAASTGKSGRKVLILGLQAKNIDLLLNDQPIHKNLGSEGVPGLEAWDIYILGPEDTARVAAQYGVQPPPA